MNRIITIFLLIIYSSTAFGIAIDYHFCKGHLSKVSILHEQVKPCGCKAAGIPKNCCNDKVQYQKADNHRIANGTTVPPIPVFIITPVSLQHDNYIAVYTISNNSAACIPFTPGQATRPIFLVNRVFRI